MDILEEHEEEFDLTLLELIEGVFSYPKDTMRFIFVNNFSKYVGLLVLCFLGLSVGSGFLGSIGQDYQITSLMDILMEFQYILITIINVYSVYVIFCFFVFIFLRLDKVSINYKTVFKFFMYAFIPWAISMFVIVLINTFFVNLGRLSGAKYLIHVMRYGVYAWSLVLFYYGLIHFTKRKQVLIGIIIISALLSGYLVPKLHDFIFTVFF
jgi:hypothetical protein